MSDNKKIRVIGEVYDLQGAATNFFNDPAVSTQTKQEFSAVASALNFKILCTPLSLEATALLEELEHFLTNGRQGN